MIKEKLSDVGQILAINLLFGAIKLPHRNFRVSVDLVTARMPSLAALAMAHKFVARYKEGEAKVANEKAFDFVVFLWKW